MENFDYYSLMEKRIKYLSKKYDPLNKFPVRWEQMREMPDCSTGQEPLAKKKIKKQLVEAFNSVIAFLF